MTYSFPTLAPEHLVPDDALLPQPCGIVPGPIRSEG